MSNIKTNSILICTLLKYNFCGEGGGMYEITSLIHKVPFIHDEVLFIF